MREKRAPDRPLRWVFRGLFGLVFVYAFNLWWTPPLGWDVWRASNVPGDTIEILGIGRHSATVIFIHGLAGNAAQVVPVVARLRQRLWQVSFLLPSATFLPLTAKGAVDTLAWFDIDNVQLTPDDPLPELEDEEGMEKVITRIHGLIDGEMAKGIEQDRIVLVGFSQGCASALLSAISSEAQIAGVACMSGWLPLSYKIKKVGTHVRHPLQTDHAHHMPVFWGHGELDDVVHLRWAEESIAHLTDLGFENIEYNIYPYLKHDMGKEEKQDLEDWLAKLLPPT